VDERRSYVQVLLINEIASLLGLSAQLILPGQSIYALGLDSLLATRLLSRIEDQLHVSLEIADFLEAPTIEVIATHIYRQLETSKNREPKETVAQLIERVEHLSDEEVAAFLETENRSTSYDSES
jgi:acyl carrier protein